MAGVLWLYTRRWSRRSILALVQFASFLSFTMNESRNIAAQSLKVGSVAVACGTVGVGIGLIQGAIVGRFGATDEMLVFAGTAGLMGGLIAFLLGPSLYYSLKRRISFEQFCVIATISLLAGTISAWLLSIRPNGPGWASMFVTPLVAVFLAINFSRGSSRL